NPCLTGSSTINTRGSDGSLTTSRPIHWLRSAVSKSAVQSTSASPALAVKISATSPMRTKGPPSLVSGKLRGYPREFRWMKCNLDDRECGSSVRSDGGRQALPYPAQRESSAPSVRERVHQADVLG